MGIVFVINHEFRPSTADTPLNKFLRFLWRGFNYLIAFVGIDFPKENFLSKQTPSSTSKTTSKAFSNRIGFYVESLFWGNSTNQLCSALKSFRCLLSELTKPKVECKTFFVVPIKGFPAFADNSIWSLRFELKSNKNSFNAIWCMNTVKLLWVAWRRFHLYNRLDLNVGTQSMKSMFDQLTIQSESRDKIIEKRFFELQMVHSLELVSESKLRSLREEDATSNGKKTCQAVKIICSCGLGW